MLGPHRFRFLNNTRDLAEHGWDDEGLDKLWRYNLHYFDDLNARDAAARLLWHAALLEKWVGENPPAAGSGWEAYPTSIRIVNWIKWALRGNMLPEGCAGSLAIQARWLSQRLERHLLGNHLFANAKALVFAGLYFDDLESAGWLDRGLRILAVQVPEQILPDGGQFERSTMYHALALEDLLDLVNVTTTFDAAIPTRWRELVTEWRPTVELMRAWLASMCHPDGEISLFNDAAMKVAPPPDSLEAYARRLGFPVRKSAGEAVTQLSASGYIRLVKGPAVAILDVGPVGPDHLPAHAHADTLSFELSLDSQRVLVNSGTSCYGADAERLRQRGTASHNTVVIDGQNSSEVWSGFRVARRARPFGLLVSGNGRLSVQCAHDGYERLPGRPRHVRRWSLDGGALIVDDTLSGAFRFAQARFHLHPAIIVREASRDGAIELEAPGGRRIHFSVEGGRLHQQPTTWHPEFGVAEPNVCLVADFAGPKLRTELRWETAP
jgi:uncharacterized heparinase superfamily protein